MSNNQIGQELIEIIRPHEELWQPCIGQETYELLGRLSLDEVGSATLRDEAIRVLSKCISPTDQDGQRTGLVLGYVQSGKTLSFTTVTALARDNKYPLVIVIAGTSIPLTNQSQKRLRRDLTLDTREDRCWRHIHNPRVENQDHTRIANILEDWHDSDPAITLRTTILITVMKHHSHLQHLLDVLSHVNLDNIPVLLIDDEGDQAGLNNLINEGDESTTYRRLRELKETIPHHTFLQYTATPQGPLLINLIDVLSPSFAITLTPGGAYTGGHHFFLENRKFVRDIPPHEIPTKNNPLHEPPDSLIQAMRIFFLGVASGLIRDGGRGNRSMMVHPSRRTLGHQLYFDWINAILNHWHRTLTNPEDPDHNELLAEFRPAYEDLSETVDKIEIFENLANQLPRAIRRADIHLVNTSQGQTPQIDWKGAYAHILVGGQALDRGFTVEGLTVTYMPRDVGSRRADTIQQRARFFGYKRQYLGYCRVYLEQQVSEAFTRYVAHEEDIRSRLEEYSQRPLRELRRAFLLPRGLTPTRDSIIDIDYVRARVNEGWFYPRVPHESREAMQENKTGIDEYLGSIDMEDDEGHPDRTQHQRHLISPMVSLREAYENLLLNLRFTSLSDAQNFLGVIVVIRQALDQNPDERCQIYLMSSGEARRRTLNDYGEIPNLFQGAAPVNPPERRGEVYPGDRQLRSYDNITIQIHVLNLHEKNSQTIYREVPNIAIHIPNRLSNDVLIQDQGGIEEVIDD